MATSSNELHLSPKFEYDPNFKGPAKHRSCTDVCCLLLFIVFLGAWAYVAFFAYYNGNPGKLIQPRDSNEHICGLEEGYKNTPYLFFFDLTACINPSVVWNGCDTPQVCVKSCPRKSWVALEFTKRPPPNNNWAQVQQDLICVNSSIANTVDSMDAMKQVLDANLCAKYYIMVNESLYQRCIPYPKDILAIQDELKKFISVTDLLNGTQYIEFLIDVQTEGKAVLIELYKMRYYLLAGVAGAMLIILIYISLLRVIAFFLVWGSILAIFGGLGFSVFYSYNMFRSIPEYSEAKSDLHQDFILTFRDTHYFKDTFHDLYTSKKTWLYLFIITTIVFFIFFLLIVFLRSRIRLTIALIGEASKCVSSIKSSLVFPVFPWTIQVVVIVWAFVIGVYIYSMENSRYAVKGLRNDTLCKCDNNYYWKDNQWCVPTLWNEKCHRINTTSSCTTAACEFQFKNPNNFVTYLFLFNIFAYFWGSSFVSDISKMILAASFATWYWTLHKRNVPFFTVTVSTFRTFRYHLGTVAFGSLLIAICKFIRFLLEYIEKKCKKFDNGFTRAILWTLRCLFWCLHKFLVFVSDNAYIMCAIHGGNFCKSARDAVSLLFRNIVRVFVVDKVSSLVLFLGKVFITFAICFSAYRVFTNYVHDPDERKYIVLEYPCAPVVVLGVLTYLIASAFFCVYSMAIDTLFLCFLEDSERNDGSAQKPYYMSKSLKRILHKKNRSS